MFKLKPFWNIQYESQTETWKNEDHQVEAGGMTEMMSSCQCHCIKYKVHKFFYLKELVLCQKGLQTASHLSVDIAMIMLVSQINTICFTGYLQNDVIFIGFQIRIGGIRDSENLPEIRKDEDVE